MCHYALFTEWLVGVLAGGRGLHWRVVPRSCWVLEGAAALPRVAVPRRLPAFRQQRLDRPEIPAVELEAEQAAVVGHVGRVAGAEDDGGHGRLLQDPTGSDVGNGGRVLGGRGQEGGPGGAQEGRFVR